MNFSGKALAEGALPVLRPAVPSVPPLPQAQVLLLGTQLCGPFYPVALFRVRISRICMFLGLLDPDPSISKQKNEEKP